MKIKPILSLLLLTSLSSCTQNNFVLNGKIFCFDTMVDISLYEGEEKDLNYIKDIFTYYDKVSDNYLSRDIANVFTINNTNEEVQVGEQLYNLLKTSIEATNTYSRYFNPLCGSLAKKWKFALNNQQILDEIEINNELEKMNNTTILFKDNYVVQRVGEAEIDLGAIVKGYANDLVYDYLNLLNYKSYLINNGSSSILLGEKKSDDGYFSVGINDLNRAYLKLKNCFISTSSKSVQGVKINNVTYSHIINPLTGMALNENDAVIVVSDVGFVGDILSTSLMMNSVEEIKTIEMANDVKTIVIRNNQIVYKNENLEVYYR